MNKLAPEPLFYYYLDKLLLSILLLLLLLFTIHDCSTCLTLKQQISFNALLT